MAQQLETALADANDRIADLEEQLEDLLNDLEDDREVAGKLFAAFVAELDECFWLRHCPIRLRLAIDELALELGVDERVRW